MELGLCKNCESMLNGNFCSNCGQKANTKRLDWNYIYDEAKYTFLHLNNGLFYTSKQLLTRPGEMVREFLEGKRVKHYKPILLVFVLAGIATILAHYNGDLALLDKLNTNSSRSVYDPKEFTNLVTKYYTLLQLVAIPIVSLCTWLGFKKWGYNFIENIIINCFATAQITLIGILTTPIKLLLMNSSLLFVISFLISLIAYGFNAWLFIKLYQGRDLGNIIIRVLLSLFYIGILFVIAVIAVAISIFITKMK